MSGMDWIGMGIVGMIRLTGLTRVEKCRWSGNSRKINYYDRRSSEGKYKVQNQLSKLQLIDSKDTIKMVCNKVRGKNFVKRSSQTKTRS